MLETSNRQFQQHFWNISMENLDTIIDLAVADNNLNNDNWFLMQDDSTLIEDENDE